MATQIHPTAIVESGAQLGLDCEVQAYAVIKKHVRLDDGVVVHPHAVIGGDPQYLKFDRRLSTGVTIGRGTVVREFATINRSIYEGKATSVGENCFLMAGCHLGHDCALGDNVILGNNVLLAGHVSVANHSFIGGGAAVHQFVRIGESVMLGGLARITRDLAPYVLAAERDEISGLNLIGLKRRGISRDAIRELKAAFRAVFFANGNIRELAAEALSSGPYQQAETRHFLEFFSTGKRNFARPSRNHSEEADDE